jgi:hypothetical protein
LLPETLNFLKEATVATVPSLLLFRQLAATSGYAMFLLKRLPALFEACQANHALREALQQLLERATFDERRGQFTWDPAADRTAARTIRKFFEYVYFSSNEFLEKVL